MRPEQQRIAIAEACGWRPGCRKTVWGDGQTFGIPPKGEDWHWQETPDYLNDLNAMNEAEKTLTNEQWDYYCEELGGSLRACAHATASLRAEAFLRTIGKWEE